MCTQIQWITSNYIQPLADTLCDRAHDVMSTVKNSAFWIDKKIDDITNNILPRPAAAVAAAMIRCLPFLAMRLMFFPGPLFWAGLSAIVVFKTVTTPENKPVTAENVENGFALGGIIEGGQQISQGIATTNLPVALFGIGNIIASCIMFLRTGLVNTVCGIPPTPPKDLHTAPSEEMPSDTSLQGATPPVVLAQQALGDGQDPHLASPTELKTEPVTPVVQ